MMSQADQQVARPPMQTEMQDTLDLFPLRQLVHVSGDAAGVFAGQRLLDWLARPTRFRIISHGGGGQICAVGSQALEEAQALLRRAYGGLVKFGAVTIHSYVDRETGIAMAPVMFVRVDAPRAHAPVLLDAFTDADQATPEVDPRKDRVVIRAEVMLSRLQPLEDAIAELTDGSAHIMSWLLGYRGLPRSRCAQCTSPREAVEPRMCKVAGPGKGRWSQAHFQAPKDYCPARTTILSWLIKEANHGETRSGGMDGTDGPGRMRRRRR